MLQAAKDLLGTRTSLIGLAESDDRFPGDAVVVFLPDAFDPLLGIDALQHKAGGGAYEAIRVGEQRPEDVHGRLEARADQGFAGAATNQGVRVVQCFDQDVLAFLVAVDAEKPNRMSA